MRLFDKDLREKVCEYMSPVLDFPSWMGVEFM